MSGKKLVRKIEPGGSGEVRRTRSVQDKLADARMRREALLAEQRNPANLPSEAKSNPKPAAKAPPNKRVGARKTTVPIPTRKAAIEPEPRAQSSLLSTSFLYLLIFLLVASLIVTAWIARPQASQNVNAVATPALNLAALLIEPQPVDDGLPGPVSVPAPVLRPTLLSRLFEPARDLVFSRSPAPAPKGDAPTATLVILERQLPAAQTLRPDVPPKTAGLPAPRSATPKQPVVLDRSNDQPPQIFSIAQRPAPIIVAFTSRAPEAQPLKLTQPAAENAPSRTALTLRSTIVEPRNEDAAYTANAPTETELRTLIPVSFHVPRRASTEQLASYRSAAEAAGFDLGETFRQPVTIRSSNVRYYHAGDEAAAKQLAEAIGADLRDFTDFRPSPPEGVIELWASGRSGVVPSAPDEPVGILEGMRRDFGILRNDIGNLLRGNRN